MEQMKDILKCWQIVAQCVGVIGPARQTTQAAQNEAALNSEVYGMIENLKELSFLSPSQKREAIKKAEKEYNIRNPNRFPRPTQLEGESEVYSSDDENATENVKKYIN